MVLGPLRHLGTLFLGGPRGLVPSTSGIISPVLLSRRATQLQRHRSAGTPHPTAGRPGGRRHRHQHRLRPDDAQVERSGLAGRGQRDQDHLRRSQRQRDPTDRAAGGVGDRARPARLPNPSHGRHRLGRGRPPVPARRRLRPAGQSAGV